MSSQPPITVSRPSSDISISSLSEAEAQIFLHGRKSVQISENSFPICKLCLEKLDQNSNTFTINVCQCTFCKECMQCYVEVLIRDGIVLSITCPDAECKSSGILSVDEIKQLLQLETFEKYQRLKFEQEVATDPHRTFCPEAMCSTVCHVCCNSSNSEQVPKPIPVTCPVWKSDHKCHNFQLSFGSEFQKLQARAGLSFGDDVLIKRCPVCNIFIEKNNGCAQMTCRNCSHVFCWYCLKVLDNDFFLRHYDKGPCRNKLGHSRSQVARHRAGVVALFAAFCLLLVVASPVLLLAAPIILCYKCWKCYEKTIKPPSGQRSSVASSSQKRSSVVVELKANHQDTPSSSNSRKLDNRVVV